MQEDSSNGYERVAGAFMAARSASGRDLVEAWAASLRQGASVIDIGAGHGEPLTSALIAAGLDVRAIDASPSLVEAFRRRFPGIEIACESVEGSRFFGHQFDAALAVGLIFLLPEASQRDALRKIAAALKPGGRLLFSAPRQVCSWDDILTGLPSRSLGLDAYRQVLEEVGMDLLSTPTDEGGTQYYDARRQPDTGS